jgi:hypothetical protein
MNPLLEGLVRQLDGDIVSQLGQQIGADPETTSNAIRVALPVILGGLANNASTPDGAVALDNALARDHDGSLLDNLGSLLGGSAPNPRAADGLGILEHILGGRQTAVQQGVERSTGLDGSQVVRLLMLLAPIVMAYLGRQKQERGLDAETVGTELQDARSRMEQQDPGLGGILGQFFDKNGDGSVADDLFRMAPGMLGGLLGGKR